MQLMPCLLCLLATLCGLWYWQRHSLFFRLLWWQALLGCLAEFIGWATIHGFITFGRGPENIPVFNLYLLAEIWLAALAVGSLFKSRRFFSGIIYGLLAISIIWVGSILKNGWFYMAIWFYLTGSILVTGLLLYAIKKNLETYFLSGRLASYLLIIFGQLLFYGAAFEALALRYLIIELGSDFYHQINYVFWTAAQIRMVFFLIAFLLLPKKTNVPAVAARL